MSTRSLHFHVHWQINLLKSAGDTDDIDHYVITIAKVQWITDNGTKRNSIELLFQILQLLLKHQDALQAANVFPDTFFDPLCRQEKYHFVSDATHWTPFLKATIDHIRKTYPRPWDEHAEKMVVFLLGVASHQVADVSWHSQVIKQGFLTTMGKVNFHGSFPDAHQVGDPASDMISYFEFDMSYIDVLSEWYIPVQDLVAIYRDYFHNDTVDAAMLEECTALMFLERLSEKLIMAKAFPFFIGSSPYILEEYQTHFLGGVDDMATWTQNVWKEMVFMLDHGTSMCDLPVNPLRIKCKANATTTLTELTRNAHTIRPVFREIKQHSLNIDDVIINRTDKGIRIYPSNEIKERLLLVNSDHSNNHIGYSKDASVVYPTATYYVTTPYAHCGTALITGDLNNDGHTDLIIGCPGYSVRGNYQVGRVYAIFGSKNGLPMNDIDLNKSADIIRQGVQKNGRFGMSVAIIDINKDDVADLAVGAPSVGSKTLTYEGQVYVFYGEMSSGKFQLSSRPMLTLNCTMYPFCNLGWSLANYGPDLVIGNPLANIPDGEAVSEERGFVAILKADKEFIKTSHLDIGGNPSHLLQILATGDMQYGWMGHDVSVVNVTEKENWLMTSQPNYRLCNLSTDCPFSKQDTQSVGKLSIYSDYSHHSVSSGSFHNIFNVTGNVEFAKMGSSVDVGRLFGDERRIMAVGANTLDTKGSVIDIPTTFKQAGSVFLYDVTELTELDSMPGKGAPTELARLDGNRNFAHFGDSVLLDDVNGDSIELC
ncbi:phosphatidylinositol-glycan-specific phospholipase D-like [Ptychodera flava]|uniref:phosphatidylinositol-glycan-specific phospholipase D-like n=1 Tax=Ptychodera flava TaxID=63121 RepID=UPI003969FEE9